MGKVLLTGGSRGIGAACKMYLEARGWEVLAPSSDALDVQDADSVDEWIDLYMPADLTAMILNAHRWFSAPLVDQCLEDFSSQMAYVQHHWWLMVQALERGALESVVAVSSTRGLIGGVESGPYAMAKAALIAMIQGFAREGGGVAVRYNAVCPGLTATDMQAQVRATGGASALAVAQDPNDVARFIVNLLEDQGANGQIWRINAGKADRMQWSVI